MGICTESCQYQDQAPVAAAAEEEEVVGAGGGV